MTPTPVSDDGWEEPSVPHDKDNPPIIIFSERI